MKIPYKKAIFMLSGFVLTILLFIFALEGVARLIGLGQQHEWRFRSDIVGSAKKSYEFIVIGGSTSYGFGLSEKDTWVQKLGDSLSNNDNLNLVLNLARLGSHLEEEIYDYHQIIRRPIPKSEWLFGDRPSSMDLANIGFNSINSHYILLAPVINDTAPLLYTLPMLYKWTPLYWLRKLVMLLNGASDGKLRASIELIRSVESKFYIYDKSKIEAANNQYSENLLKATSVYGRDKLILVGLPIKFNKNNYNDDEFCNLDTKVSCNTILLEAEYLTKSVEIEINVRQELSEKYDIKLCEMSGIFNSLGAENISNMFIDSIHLNSEGTNIAACNVAKCLKNFGLISFGCNRN